ncbi:TPA: hypothetical protein ACHWKL_004334 [Providencia stuartii]|nr:MULTISPECIES: hypothetical protein [Providencia]MDF4176425.1 hypothetical protein [Providencia thailandensis]QUC26454.1 hypothetical protein JY390_03635 [Providencia stuartii]WIJ76156.1 hypothetical protein OI982_08885 [Providencia thailandensis]HEM7179522.1 hypothetical protein [Providencia stuartii]HEM8186542.1 hypothetical protein [Providencia stuartii]
MVIVRMVHRGVRFGAIVLMCPLKVYTLSGSRVGVSDGIGYRTGFP